VVVLHLKCHDVDDSESYVLRDGFFPLHKEAVLLFTTQPLFELKWRGFCMKVISFSLYYCKLQVGILLGLYKTAYPLSLNWRWNHWQNKYHSRRDRPFWG
jgi:hypothetical protein